jgi:hypothetical protein
MRYLAPVALTVAGLLAPATAVAQNAGPTRTLELSFNNGKATLVARGVTVPEIMAEWARKGGSVVTNAEKLAGGPVSYEFHDVPEAVVLQSVLRSAAGFIAAPRRPGGPTGASGIEQVMILAVSRPSASAVITMPTYQNPMPNPVTLQGSPDDDIPSVAPQRLPPPQPQPPGPANQPSAPATSQTPGVVIPPVTPGKPVAPGVIIKSPTQ